MSGGQRETPEECSGKITDPDALGLLVIRTRGKIECRHLRRFLLQKSRARQTEQQQDEQTINEQEKKKEKKKQPY